MSSSYILYDSGMIQCSVCKTGPEEIVDGRSEHYRVTAMRDLKNPGKYEERLLWWAECVVCRRQTDLGDLPKLYY